MLINSLFNIWKVIAPVVLSDLGSVRHHTLRISPPILLGKSPLTANQGALPIPYRLTIEELSNVPERVHQKYGRDAVLAVFISSGPAPVLACIHLEEKELAFEKGLSVSSAVTRAEATAVNT